MTEAGHILVRTDTGERYRVCGCLQVFPDRRRAEAHRQRFSGEPDMWEVVEVTTLDRATGG